MRQRSLAGTVLATFTLFVSLPAHSQDGIASTAANSTEFDSIVVTGTRTTSSAYRLADAIAVIDRATIEASQANSLAELLRSRAGVEVLDFYGDGSRASFGMRGFGENAASNALILIDGQPLNNPDIGGQDLARISLDSIERIEVLQGGSALWGNQAVGGVIHIITRKNLTSSVELEYGSYASTDAHARAAYAGQGWSMALSGASRDSDNYRDNNALERDQGALEGRIEGRLAQAWLRAEYSDETLQTPGGLFPDEVAANRRQSAPDFAGDFSALRTFNLSTGLTADLGKRWQFTGQASRYDASGKFKLSFRGFAGDPATQDRRIVSANPQWTFQFDSAMGAGHVAMGADVQRADYVLTSQFGVQSNEQSTDDFYVSALLPLHQRAHLSLSGRHARIEDHIADPGPFAVLPDGQDFRHQDDLGSVGLNIQLQPRLSLLMSWDQVLRYPKVDEYFGSGFTPDTIDLEPQTGDNFEVGLQFHSRSLNATVLAYRLDLENEIVFDPGTFSNTNLDASRRDGVSATANWSFASSHSLDFSYSYIDAQIDNAGRIPLVARQHGQVSLNLGLGHGVNLNTQVQASGDRLAGGDTDGSAPALPGYAVVNLALRWQVQNLEVGLKLANVLDKRYAEQGFEDSFSGRVASFPLPEFNTRLQMRYDFK